MHRLHRCHSASIAILVFICIVFLSSSYSSGWDETCSLMGDIAGSIMEGRQSGVPKSEQLNRIEDSKKENPNVIIDSMIESIIIAAYDYPVLNNEIDKKKDILDFKYFWYLKCLDDIE